MDSVVRQLPEKIHLQNELCVLYSIDCIYLAHTKHPTVESAGLNADCGRPQLRSAHANVLTVPRTNTRLCHRSFSVAGPRIWNSLPALLRQPDIEFGHFKRLLKAFLFGETAAYYEMKVQ